MAIGINLQTNITKCLVKKYLEFYNAIVFDWGTFIAAFLFGLFYYLFKGMWLKALVYSIVILILNMILLALIPSLGATTYTLSIIFAYVCSI